MKTYTKAELIEALVQIRNQGFIRNKRRGNHGGIGNTLEDLLGIEENNLPLPNAGEWELKTQKLGSNALNTLFHMEPSPRALQFVRKVLLPLYGWPHEKAGLLYPASEMSFRQTINGLTRSDRGFRVLVNEAQGRVEVSFDAATVDSRHADWLTSVAAKVGLGELNPQPYWGLTDLFHKAGTKLSSCFFVQAEVEMRDSEEFYFYDRIMMLSEFSIDGLVRGLHEGWVLVDFDARTGHNHGTKFRLRQNRYPQLYKNATIF